MLGTLIGAIPGAGGAIGSMIAYTQERKWSKLSDKFGTGIDEGIAAPETANNSVVAGTLIPTLGSWYSWLRSCCDINWFND